MPGSRYTIAFDVRIPPGYSPGKSLNRLPATAPELNEHVAGAASVAGRVPPGQPVGTVAPSRDTTAAGAPGWAGGGRLISGSPETRTPAGAEVQLFTAPPDVAIPPTTSHSGDVKTPFPLRRMAPDGHDESTCTVPFVVTMVPAAPLILFVPQPVGSSARREYGKAISLALVATAAAPVRCCGWPRMPWKNEPRVESIVTSMWPGNPLNAEGAMGGRSTRTV